MNDDVNDDVKAAVDELRDAVNLDRQRCSDDMAESLWRNELLILAHIDGEQARQDAAVAAAREEQREACWDVVSDNHDEPYSKTLRALAAMPLTATPLADRIAELEAEAKALRHDADAEWGASATERESLRAERDALRAQVAEAAERLDEFGSQPTLADGIQAMRLRLVELRAQVEAARAMRPAIEWADTTPAWRAGCGERRVEGLIYGGAFSDGRIVLERSRTKVVSVSLLDDASTLLRDDVVRALQEKVAELMSEGQ